MDVRPLRIPEVKLLVPRRFADDRGFFCEVYSEKAFRLAGLDYDFVQDNHSYSKLRGTLRGLHFQKPPFAQCKLIRVLRGRVFDVAVDIRRGSPTYSEYVASELSADQGDQLLIPVGFAHGFVTLEPDTEVEYKVTNPYAPDCDRGLLWSDPQINVAWPIPPEGIVLSAKDHVQPTLDRMPPYFSYPAETQACAS